jgi:hypothetical protein
LPEPGEPFPLVWFKKVVSDLVGVGKLDVVEEEDSS